MTKTTNSTPHTFEPSGEATGCEDEFDKLVARYWAAYANERSAQADDLDDLNDLFGSVDENISVALRAVAWAPATELRHVTAKARILQHVFGEPWTNARVEIVAASIRKDLENLGG